MSFNSLEFLVFFLTAIICYRTIFESMRPWVLFAANVYFVASFASSSVQLLPLGGLLLLGYAFIKNSHSALGRRLLSVEIAVILFTFIYLKRYTFVGFLPYLQFPYLELGMSYMFFRIVHLIVDRTSGAIAEDIGLISYFNYVCFFPYLVSGPIQLWQDHFPQRSMKSLTEPLVSHSVSRMLTGYIKVFTVAPILKLWHDANAINWIHSFVPAEIQEIAFGSFAAMIQRAMTDQPYILTLWLVMASTIFLLYVYFNFSGYMDIIIGAGQLLGFKLPENFNHPFTAPNFIDFWNRWHITLSEWFKIYVFNPTLKVMMHHWDSPKLIPYLGCITYFFTFLLLGIWHGRTLMYIVLGFLLGGGVSVNKLYQIQAVRILGRKRYKTLAANKTYIAVCRGLTFSYISICLSCMWMSARDFSNIFGSYFIPIVLCSCLLLTAFSAGIIQAQVVLDSWLARKQECFASWTNTFLIRNGWLTLKLFVYTLIIIQSTQPQKFLYEGF